MDDKVDLKSLDIKKDKIDQLKKAFPEVVTEGKVDFEKLKSELGEEIETGKERYEMKWPGKASLQKIIQEPSIGTLKPVKDDSVEFDTTENLFIEGDSLEVLKLLQKSYYGKIKMIYIDPPYNTGQDFVYPDNYSESLDTYLRYTGQKGEEGLKLTTNAETEGRYHSKWMNMMYPRLFLARNLLKEDGVIFISIDDHELDNLKKMCNEIFGEENFITQIIWQKKYTQSNDATFFSYTHEYVICIAKDSSLGKGLIGRLARTEEQNRRYTNPDNDPKGPWKAIPLHARSGSRAEEVQFNNGVKWSPPPGTFNRFSVETLKGFESEGKLYFGKNGNSVPVYKRYLSEVGDLVPKTIWEFDEVGSTDEARQELKDLMPENVFDTPKPTRLMQRMIQLTTATDKRDFVLDFFAGSSSTAHSLIKQNFEDLGIRNFIMVQLQEPTTEYSEAYKAGYKNIAEIGKERIRRVIKKIKEENDGKLDFDGKKMDLGFKVFRLSESNFKIWDKKSDAPLQQQLPLAVSNIKDDSSDEEILYEIILKSGFELSVPVEKLEILGKSIYSVDNKSLLICLENNLTSEFIKEVASLGGVRVVFLDRGFAGNDQLKTNTVELMKVKGVEFKTV